MLKWTCYKNVFLTGGREYARRKEHGKPGGPKRKSRVGGAFRPFKKKIREKREGEDKKKVLAAAAAAVAVVAAVAVAGGLLGERNQDGVMKVETAAASLETTAPLPQEPTQASIVLETTLSAEEQASKEYEETVQSVLDGYANLGDRRGFRIFEHTKNAGKLR